MSQPTKFTHCYYVPGARHLIDLATADGTPAHGISAEETLKQHPEAVLIPFEEGVSRTTQANNAKYVEQPPKEISEEKFTEMLEMLPPLNWVGRNGGETFFFSEAQTGSIHAVFARIGEKYYRLYARLGTSHDEIISRLKAPTV